MTAKRAKIGFNLLYVRPGYLGGTVRYALELLRWLYRSGRYDLLVYVQKGVLPDGDAELSRIPRHEFAIAGGLIGRVAAEHLMLPAIATRHAVDVLFSPGFVSPLWGHFAKVVTIHDLYYRLFPAFVRPWQRRYWSVFVPASLRAADAAIVVSRSTLRDVSNAFPWARGKLRCIAPGADAMQPPAAVSASHGKYCLVVGNVTPNKEIDTVLAALAGLNARGVECGLVIAGGDPLGILSRALRHAPHRVQIRFVEHAGDAELAGLYAGALCLVQASRYEGFGLPVAEAMYLGCPVVASDVGVLREVGAYAASYFRVGDSRELAACIERLLRDGDQRLRMIDAGRCNAQRFRWAAAAHETALVFDALLPPARRSDA